VEKLHHAQGRWKVMDDFEHFLAKIAEKTVAYEKGDAL
jgi:hypothetical protein